MAKCNFKGENMNKVITVVGVIICLIFIPILIINTILIVKSYINPDTAPDFLGYKPFIVLSGSMEPTINTGDIAIIKKCKADEIKEGDIIAFRSGKSVITHRIVEINNSDSESKLVTKGDNNNSEDRYPVNLETVEGIFVYRIPKLGNFAMFLQTTLGTVIFISIPFILFIIFDVAQRKKDNKIQKQKQEKLEKELEELKKKNN